MERAENVQVFLNLLNVEKNKTKQKKGTVQGVSCLLVYVS